jgi:diacylglycerol kinase (ATP)
MWKRVVLCHNSGAGKNDHRKAELLEALALAGINAEYCSTESDDFPAMLDTHADLIIAAGGDGTVGKVAKYLGGRDVPLGILPVGTANNIARSFGIFGSPHEIAEGWRKDQFIACDIPMATIGNKNRLFAESIGLGLFSEAIREKAGRGKGVTKLKAARERLREMLAAAEAFEVRLDIDGKMRLDGEVLALEVMNIAFAGPGLSILSTGDMCRGLLHTMVFREKSREKCRPG